MAQINRATVIGGGVIGAGWVARLAVNGVDVAVYDPDEAAPQKVAVVMENAVKATDELIDEPRPASGMVNFCKTIEQAVDGSDLIVEAVPERLDVKRAVYEKIEEHASPGVLVASSTSGLLPSDLQENMTHPERLLVAHPFNPVYLIPLVELVGGNRTATGNLAKAAEVFNGLGMKPLHVRREIDAFIADRLLEAVWREALWLVADDIATTTEIDDAIKYGFGLRWAQMGLFETYRIAGGSKGMRHFMAQFGPCLQWPWSRLVDVPELTDELVEKIASQSDQQSGEYSIARLEQIRDKNLVAILKALKSNNWAAGKTVSAHESRLRCCATSRDDHDGLTTGLPWKNDRSSKNDY